jgi:uncharacterized Zn finger protein
MTTLANFQEKIEPVILKRGRSYYEKGRILELREQETGFWFGKVLGNAEYNVAVRFLEDNNLVWACTCDYDDGPACQHIAAVLYALEAGLGKPSVQKPAPRKEQKAKGDNIREHWTRSQERNCSICFWNWRARIARWRKKYWPDMVEKK